MPDPREVGPPRNERSWIDPRVQPVRPTVDPRFRHHPIPDPARYYQPSRIYLNLTAPNDCSFTLYADGGKPVLLTNRVAAGVRTRARYAFALTVRVGENRERYFGTIDVVRGPLVPMDVDPRDAAVPLAFDDEDLLHILHQRMLTKFIVLENPETALDYPSDPNLPIRYDATFESDAVRRAKELGKILVVVRLGDRVPTEEELATVEGGLTLGRSMEVVDASGRPRRLRPEYVPAENYPNGDVQPVAHHPGSRGGFGATAGDAEACGGDGCKPRPGGPPGVDPRFLLNNDLTNNYEYLCDGGDRRPRVGWSTGGQVVNIDPEDTIAEYRTASGGKRFAVSNRVCLFSPRYVELRVLQAAEGYSNLMGHGAVDRDHRPATYLSARPALERKAYGSAGLVRGQRGPHGLEGAQWPDSAYEVRILLAERSALGWAEIVGLFGPHHVTGTQQPEILARVAFADSLTLDLQPQVVGMEAGTGEIVVTRRVHELNGVHERECPDVLRLEKSADRSAAKVGEIVVFAIRYTNLGRRPISNIAVTDSLTTRLEYVPDSADSDRPAAFAASPNNVGSTMLRWEIQTPLPPGESGHVRFSAIVR
jgi:uncharacterized repeat protein (TIGR01451 family)